LVQVAAQLPPNGNKSARMQLYAWVVERVTGPGAEARIKISDVLEEVQERFIADPTWVRSFMEETVSDMARSTIRDAVASTRGQYRRYVANEQVLTGPEWVKEGQALGNRLMSKWASWMEFDGTSHVRLGDMRRQDLLKAAQTRRKRAEREIELATLWEAIAARLPDDETPVSAVLEWKDIELLSMEIKQGTGTFSDPTITPITPITPTTPAE
jgi:hypothetical protein